MGKCGNNKSNFKYRKMKSRTGEVCMSPEMAYWSAIQLELVVERTGVGVVVTHTLTTLDNIVLLLPHNVHSRNLNLCGWKIFKNCT